MSRHSITSGSRRFAYGFDHPTSIYFFDAFVGNTLFAGGDCTGAELLEAAATWGVTLPAAHATCAVLDLPIDDLPAAGGTLAAGTFDAQVEDAGFGGSEDTDCEGDALDACVSDDNWACGTLDPET